jgi:F420-dependent oxidoreductase-like protein
MSIRTAISATALACALVLAAPAAWAQEESAAPEATPATEATAAAPAAAGPKRLQFGIMTPAENTTWTDLVEIWREADAGGVWDSAWLNDHLMRTFGDRDEPQFEAWTLLSALASQTKRLRIGVLVSGNTYRNPALLAKTAATVDQISNGRLYLGIGAAWFEPEHTAYGFHFGTAKERAERLDEALQVITKLFADEHPNFEGKYYTLKDAPFAPRSVQQPRPPIVIGGQGKKWIVPLVARYADGYNASVAVSPEGFKERITIIREECERVGRTRCPDYFSKMFVLVNISDIPLAGPITRLGARALVSKEVAQNLLAGSPSGIADQIVEYVNAGCNEVIVNFMPPFDREQIRRFTNEVIPRVKEKAAAS